MYTIGDIRAKQRKLSQATINALEQMHKDVAVRSEKKHLSAAESHNRKTNVRAIKFAGDFVLRGIMQRERAKKTSLK